MLSFRPFVFLIPIFLFFVSCASNYFNGSTLETSEKEFQSKNLDISLTVNDVKVSPDKNLKNIYAASLEKASCKNPNITLDIQGNIQQNKNSAWYLGMALMIPFWPAMPTQTKLLYSLNASLYCDSELFAQISLQEEEEVNLFFYGAIRMSPINEASDMIHRKFAARLSNAIFDNKPADTSIFNDFEIKN